ncbi:hypothetical protein QJS10_CPA10g01126 [Acorus calamus]|uniref:Uncharacterized protein n=1 Tax=Acorus calamus TaxID=4465 RepID=A0AAV9E0U9_ACOCL|nr:hypothetical protein QJS10_CPA10g01126 [Acorus calamus]
MAGGAPAMLMLALVCTVSWFSPSQARPGPPVEDIKTLGLLFPPDIQKCWASLIGVEGCVHDSPAITEPASTTPVT